jgi:PEP-CTERM motif
MKRSILALAALALLICGASAVHADTITITETATMSGSLDGVSFTNALVTFTVVADPANSSNGGAGTTFRLPGVTTVTVAGITDTLSDASTGAVVNQGSGLAGISDFTTHIGLLFTIDPAAFDTYTLMSSIGPVSGNSEVSIFDFATDNGSLDLSSAGQATFTAVETTPEPGTIAMFGIGLAGILVLMKKKALA